jgi:hypothetical protein
VVWQLGQTMEMVMAPTLLVDEYARRSSHIRPSPSPSQAGFFAKMNDTRFSGKASRNIDLVAFLFYALARSLCLTSVDSSPHEPQRRTALTDSDSPWKEVLDQFLPLSVAFLFPDIYEAISWERRYEVLDKELQQIMHDAELGKRLADKLFKVWLKNGEEAWVLIHIELQNQLDREFAERMYVYNYRIYDRYRHRVASLAVLGDEETSWRPNEFSYDLWGCQAGLRFRAVKLLDYAGQDAELESDPNPFALVVLAHLKTLETRNDAAARRTWKLRTTKGLYERGLDGEQIRRLFRILDWMMELPPELEEALIQDLADFEKEKKVPYVTNIERIARQKGIAEGKAEEKAESVLRLLRRLETQTIAEDLASAIRGTMDPARLDQWFEFAADAKSIDDFRNRAGI